MQEIFSLERLHRYSGGGVYAGGGKTSSLEEAYGYSGGGVYAGGGEDEFAVLAVGGVRHLFDGPEAVPRKDLCGEDACRGGGVSLCFSYWGKEGLEGVLGLKDIWAQFVFAMNFLK